MSASGWRGWLAAGAILLLGITLGVGGTLWLGGRIFRQALQTANDRGFAERTAARIGADLTKALQLTADESARVQAVLDESATRLKGVRTQAAVKAVAELRAASQRIAAELPPAKRAEYRQLVFKRYERLGLPKPALDPSP